jgi:hypothetical protein
MDVVFVRSNRTKRIRAAWVQLKSIMIENRVDSARKRSLEQFERERSGIIAERAAAFKELELQRTRLAVSTHNVYILFKICFILLRLFSNFFV